MGFLMLALTVQSVFAQYPEVPKEDQQKAEAMLEAAMRRSDSIWNNFAYPIVKEEARHGRPYVPGGRGKRVTAVTSLADSSG